MPDGRTPRRSTGKLRGLHRPPVGTPCIACGDCTERLKWHHCHECGAFVAWLCNGCNLTLTEHAIAHWDDIATAHQHRCEPSPQLFPVDGLRVRRPRSGDLTRSLYLSNGGGDTRYVQVSRDPDLLTAEQLGVVLGMNANSARSILNGRSGPQWGQKIGGVWFITRSALLDLLRERWAA